ncbi:MAG: PIN domain-containing protein [Bacteroidetes bacterium]|jgi:predicted nucleic acid-binding protein|nr:PIN domain-containing protein [Bacteroidota bacterium]
MSKILIDTNILVYGIDEDSAFFKRARGILEQEKNQLITTSKNLVEFLSSTTKSSGYNLDNDTALEIVEEIISGVEIVYPSQESMAIFLDLMRRYQPKGLKVHDLEIISIGLANGVHEVATFNTKDFKTIKEISLLDV